MIASLGTVGRYIMAFTLSLVLAACASSGAPKPPDPGTKKWYEQRMLEIETAKAEGKLTEEEYIALKNEADATRSEHLDRMRDRDYPPVGIGFGLGFGTYHHHHHHH